MVMATGANSLPSSPSRVSKGKNTTQMINTPDTTGLTTWRTAPSKISVFDKAWCF